MTRTATISDNRITQKCGRFLAIEILISSQVIFQVFARVQKLYTRSKRAHTPNSTWKYARQLFASKHSCRGVAI